MISHVIAEESGMSYVKMSGGDLAQYIKRGEHVTALNKLMDMLQTSWRPWSTKPWVLFIDEAESLCRDRGNLSKLPTAEFFDYPKSPSSIAQELKVKNSCLSWQRIAWKI